MAVRTILQLGNPDLYRKCVPVRRRELASLYAVVEDLRDTLMDFRGRYRAGRAIAAPQIGIFKRLIYMEVERPIVLVNPELETIGTELMELWDDCMSFPDLLVHVRRYRRCRVTYRQLDWSRHELDLEGPSSELLQHECDHLDGILAVARAIDEQSFALKSQVREFGRVELSAS